VDLPEHAAVAEDLAKVDRTDPSLALRLARLMSFTAHIEKLARRRDYQRLWPDRVPKIGELSFARRGVRHDRTGHPLYLGA
jgi:hypothetical protein